MLGRRGLSSAAVVRISGGGGLLRQRLSATATQQKPHLSTLSNLGTTTDLNRQIVEAARMKQSGVSLQTLMQFGRGMEGEAANQRLMTAAQWLHNELPVRLAHRVVELDNLPHGLHKTKGIRRVADWYKHSFQEIRSFPSIDTREKELAFTRLLESIYERHAPTVFSMAMGMLEFRRILKLKPGEPLPAAMEEDLQRWLDAFFLSRVGIRTLISQHVNLHEPKEGWVGIIDTHCSPIRVVQEAAFQAKLVCDRSYGEAPDVIISGPQDFRFFQVPSYVNHIVFEVLKNSMRAVMETHGKKGNGGKLPPIRILVAADESCEDVTIRISDQGGGIPRSHLARIFKYLYTTAQVQLTDENMDSADFSTESPMAGLGFGLGLSRVFARFWGGDLQLISMHGNGPEFGTDAYIFLPRLGDGVEPLSECSVGSATLSQLAQYLAANGGGGSNNSGGAGDGSLSGSSSGFDAQLIGQGLRVPPSLDELVGGAASTSSTSAGLLQLQKQQQQQQQQQAVGGSGIWQTGHNAHVGAAAAAGAWLRDHQPHSTAQQQHGTASSIISGPGGVVAATTGFASVALSPAAASAVAVSAHSVAPVVAAGASHASSGATMPSFRVAIKAVHYRDPTKQGGAAQQQQQQTNKTTASSTTTGAGAGASGTTTTTTAASSTSTPFTGSGRR